MEATAPSLPPYHRWISALLLALLFLAPFSGRVQARAASSRPVKLVVLARPQSIQSGDVVQIRLVLNDDSNRTVIGSKDYPVRVEVRLPSHRQQPPILVTIRAGQSSVGLPLRLEETGITEVGATDPELLAGGTVIYVRSRSRADRGSSLPRLPWLSPEPNAGPELIPAARFARFSPGRLNGKPWVTLASFSGTRPDPAAQAANPQPARPAWRLIWAVSPQRPIKADGIDCATITAFLEGSDMPPGDIRVRLFCSDGSLQPIPLVISRTTLFGGSRLTAAHPGPVTVQFIGASPAASLDGPRELNVQFAPPVDALDLDPDPSPLSVLDTGELTVRLLDENGRSVATDAPRTVHVAIESGTGRLKSRDLTIENGASQSSTTYTPVSPGKVRFRAWTDGLSPSECTLDVRAPQAGSPLTIGLGGLLGWLLALLLGRTADWSGGRIEGLLAPWLGRNSLAVWFVTGLIMSPLGITGGFLLYWLAIVGALPHLSNAVWAQQVASSWWGVFFVPAIGGFAGPMVLTTAQNLFLPAGGEQPQGTIRERVLRLLWNKYLEAAPDGRKGGPVIASEGQPAQPVGSSAGAAQSGDGQ